MVVYIEYIDIFQYAPYTFTSWAFSILGGYEQGPFISQMK